jgi:hypothetical protein
MSAEIDALRGAGGDMEITEQIAATVLATVDAGLVSGMGTPIPGQMCACEVQR